MSFSPPPHESMNSVDLLAGDEKIEALMKRAASKIAKLKQLEAADTGSGFGSGGSGGRVEAGRRRRRDLLEVMAGPGAVRRAEVRLAKGGAGGSEAMGRRLQRATHDVYHGKLKTEPCLNQPPVVGFAFDRLKGLPARCVDALGLCISSLTSTVETSKLLEMELIPPTQSHLGFENVTCGHVGECT